jgi:hypothetical protein
MIIIFNEVGRKDLFTVRYSSTSKFFYFMALMFAGLPGHHFLTMGCIGARGCSTLAEISHNIKPTAVQGQGELEQGVSLLLFEKRFERGKTSGGQDVRKK